MEERVMVLRDVELDEHGAQRTMLTNKVSMQTPACGNGAEQRGRAFTVNGVVRPQIEIAPGKRQFWRIANASPDLYADREINGGAFDVVALDGMPFAFDNPGTRSRTLSHVLLAPAARVKRRS
jgi:suppressor of ftsI